MNSAPQTASPAHSRSESVIMGRQNFVSVVLRLVGTELYKIRRRTMTRVFIGIAAGVMITSFLFIAPLEGELLRLPNSLMLATQVAQSLGLLITIILAATMAGSEFSIGTIRLILTRGPTRTQYLLAKVGAIIACIIVSMLFMITLGVITGSLVSIARGVSPSFQFLNGGWLLHTTLFLLSTMLDLFMYAMIAMTLATLGRATAAGIAGALIWWGLENILGVSGLLYFLGSLNKGWFGDFLKALPDYLISVNVNTLQQNQEHFAFGSQPASLMDQHALLVLACYLVLLIGLSWLVITRRDITN